MSATVLTAPTLLRGQQPAARKVEIGLAVGGSAMPDALSTRCGSRINGDGSPGGELGVSALRRLGHSVALQMDTRFLLAPILPSGCYLVLPAVDTAYRRSLWNAPLVTSTVRLAVETPRPMPLFRLSAGTGLAWGGHPAPLAVLALAWSTRGEGKRFFVEAERMQTRVDADERYNSLRAGQEAFTRPIVVRSVVKTVRFGLSWLRK